MVYSDVLLEHFQRPRNAGRFENPDAVADGENPICGDRLHVELHIEDEIIVEMRWSAEGCVPSIAAASVASELLAGTRLRDVGQIDGPALSAGLGGVPARKSHALALVLSTIAQATQGYDSNSARKTADPSSTIQKNIEEKQ